MGNQTSKEVTESTDVTATITTTSVRASAPGSDLRSMVARIKEISNQNIQVVIVAPPECGSKKFVNWCATQIPIRVAPSHAGAATRHFNKSQKKLTSQRYSWEGIQCATVQRMMVYEAEARWRAKQHSGEPNLTFMRGSSAANIECSIRAAREQNAFTVPIAEMLTEQSKVCWQLEKYAAPTSTTLYVYLQPEAADYASRVKTKGAGSKKELAERLRYFGRVANCMDEMFMRSEFGVRNYAITVRLESDFVESQHYAERILERILSHMLELAQRQRVSHWALPVPLPLKGTSVIADGIYTVTATPGQRRAHASVTQLFDKLASDEEEARSNAVVAASPTVRPYYNSLRGVGGQQQ
jgi:hypothetical protein